MRTGKTARDMENGCGPRNQENRGLRSDWMRGDLDEFPAYTCNGKRARAEKAANLRKVRIGRIRRR